MNITRVLIKNYRRLRDSNIELHDRLNIVVGDNECGKSTFLEAVHLALTCQLNGRHIQGELHPFLFNVNAVNDYIKALRAKQHAPPPKIVIEVYLNDELSLAHLKGIINSRSENVPGVCLSIEFNEECKSEYASYIADPVLIRTLPIEYYKVDWRSFADGIITSRSIPIKPTFIDASTIRNTLAANRYVIDMIKGFLDNKQQSDLALSYRLMKDQFNGDNNVQAINKILASKRTDISDKIVSLSLDTSARASWEAGVIPNLDDIPMPLIGKGEQSSVKVKLAMQLGDESHLFLIEEPENHLSFSNLNILIGAIRNHKNDKQLIITTHSSFVLNKLGVESVLLFRNGKGMTLKELPDGTHDYFIKLPGHETLRMILAKRAILVEGPSDELIVQKAFFMKHGKMPLEMGVDVITVNSLAFKRFLEIASQLDIKVDVITDNDGKIEELKTKYKDYIGNFAKKNIQIHFDEDVTFKTLEPQLLKVNSLTCINKILGKSFATDDELLKFMESNKTENALRFFESDTQWAVPEYIANAIY